jgi:hypothetical protein
MRPVNAVRSSPERTKAGLFRCAEASVNVPSIASCPMSASSPAKAAPIARLL